MPFTPKSKLPRLSRESYQGQVSVFWTHTCEIPKIGWLNQAFHTRFREVMLHACARYALACPIYVLMPDHWHLIWMGLEATSDQRLATAFLRKHLRAALGSVSLQDRAHDHVLREEECERDAFMATCHYIRENPVRAGLVKTYEEWHYAGAFLCGYPDLDPSVGPFWDDFWKIYNRLVSPGETSPVARSGRSGT